MSCGINARAELTRERSALARMNASGKLIPDGEAGAKSIATFVASGGSAAAKRIRVSNSPFCGVLLTSAMAKISCGPTSRSRSEIWRDWSPPPS